MKFLLWFAALACLPAHASEVPGADFGAGGSLRFPTYFKNLGDGGVSGDRVRQILAAENSHFDLGFANFELHAPVDLKAAGAWPSHFSFGLGAEAAGSVLAPANPANEIRTARIAVGYVRGLFDGNLADDFYLGVGLAVGGGNERQADVDDTGGASPTISSRQETVLMAGADLKLQKIWRLAGSDGQRIVSTFKTKETFFKALQPVGNVDWDLAGMTSDWRLRTDFLVSRYNLNVVIGKHPYPTDLLPRVWNRVEDTTSRNFKSLFGAGGGASFGLGQNVKGAVLVGYYVGALGGEFRLQVPKVMQLHLTSYEVVDSGAFTTFYQRAYAASLGFEW